MTLREAFLFGKELLKKSGIEEYEIDAWLLLQEICGCTRNDYYVRGEQVLKPEQEQRYRLFLEKRNQRIPVQHILGKQEFMGLTLLVTPDVLIPRQDTEILVEETLKLLKKGECVLDLCTGSGCILLSILSYAEKCKGTGADLSAKALAVARKNAEMLDRECTFIESDLFENIDGSYDVIVSNPPYIATKEIETLMPEVREHDPMMALDGGEDGLLFYRKIVRESVHRLNSGGRLIFEIGCTQGTAVASMMKEAGFCEVKIKKDLAGLDRVVFGKLQEE